MRIGKEMSKMILCGRCGCKVDVEKEVTQYPYCCPYCDENMYGIECFDTDDLMDILYGLYLHEWVASHSGDEFDEMEPVCRMEFMNNELLDEEYIVYLLSMYGLWHRIPEYRRMLGALQVWKRIEEYTKIVEEYKKMLEESE